MPLRKPNKRGLTKRTNPQRAVAPAPVALPVPTHVTSRRLGDPREVRFSPTDDAWLVEITRADSAATDSKVMIADVVRTAVAYYRQARERSAESIRYAVEQTKG